MCIPDFLALHLIPPQKINLVEWIGNRVCITNLTIYFGILVYVCNICFIMNIGDDCPSKAYYDILADSNMFHWYFCHFCIVVWQDGKMEIFWRFAAQVHKDLCSILSHELPVLPRIINQILLKLLKYRSEEKGSSLCKCSILLGFFMSKKLERLRSELLSEDKITNLLGFLTK